MDPTIIKAARVEQDLTQTELAAILGVSPMSIASWETGRRSIHPKRKPTVEAALGLAPGVLGSTSTRRGPQPLKKAPTPNSAGANLHNPEDRLKIAGTTHEV